MNQFSRSSERRLLETHPDLQRIFRRALQVHDCSIIYGARTKAEQSRLVEQGLSRTMDSKHLVQPDGFAHAVDVAPYPIDWENTKRFYYFAGMVLTVADEMGVKLRWGGDWNRNHDLDDQDFMDLVHWEIA